MATQKIKFTVKRIEESGPLVVNIESAEFPTKEGKKAAEKIFFIGSPDEWKDIKNVLESKKSDGVENKTFELRYDEEDLEVEKDENLFMCGKASSGPAKHGPEKKKNHKLNESKELRIWELNLITVAEEKQNDDQNNPKSDQNQPDEQNEKDEWGRDKHKLALIEKNISEIWAKLEAAGINIEQEVKILGNVWENSYLHQHRESIEIIEKMKKEALEDIDKYIAKNSNKTHDRGKENQGGNEQDQPPKTPEPTPEQVNQAKDKLNQAKESGKEEDIIKALKETSDTTKNSSDKDLAKEKEETERKLSKDKLREIIREEIKKELTENRVKPEELTLPIKQKLDELNNNNNDQATRTEIFNEIGKQSLNKLISDIEQVLKSGDKKQIASKIKELQQFINSKTDYKQNAYKIKKDKVEKLLAQAKNQSSQNNEGFFRPNNPLMWVSGVAIVSLVVGIILVVRVRRKKSASK